MAHHEYSAWSLVPPGAWPAKHFTVKEFAQRGTGWNEGYSPIQWDDDFILKLDALREAVGEPLVLSSGYRSPAYNSHVSHTGTEGPHTTGKAADFLCSGSLAHKLLKAAFALGFTGVGIDQKGLGHFVHLDILTTPPRPNVWTY